MQMKLCVYKRVIVSTDEAGKCGVRGAFDAVRRSLLSPQRLHLSCRFPNNCLLSAFTSSEQSSFVDITAQHTDL